MKTLEKILNNASLDKNEKMQLIQEKIYRLFDDDTLLNNKEIIFNAIRYPNNDNEEFRQIENISNDLKNDKDVVRIFLRCNPYSERILSSFGFPVFENVR